MDYEQTVAMSSKRKAVDKPSFSPIGIITVYFDGGCGPSNPGNCYGSFEVMLDGESMGLERRHPHGWGTSNFAEFQSLIRGLDFALDRLEVAGLPTERYAVEIFTDSMIVRNRINGRNKTRKDEPQQRMFALAEQCFERLRRFGSFTIAWHSRENNVARFGH